MRFIVMLDPQLQMLGYSANVVGDLAASERYVFDSNGTDYALDTLPFSLQRDRFPSRCDYLDAGYVEVTAFATKASSFQGHFRSLQRFDAMFRRYWQHGGRVTEPAQYANPLHALLTWERTQPGIGAPGQSTLSLPLVPVVRGASGPSKYDFCR